MTFDELDFQWDSSIDISNRLYPSTTSSNNGTKVIETIKYSAKEWIKNEVYQAKSEIVQCETKRKNLSQLKSKYQRIKKFNSIYNGDIEPMDFLSMVDSDKLEIMYENMKYKFLEKEDNLKKEIEYINKDVRTKIFTIKRICLENVSLILKVEGVKKFNDSARHLLYMNDIDISNNNKHKEFQINYYKQMYSSSKIPEKNYLCKLPSSYYLCYLHHKKYYLSCNLSYKKYYLSSSHIIPPLLVHQSYQSLIHLS